MRHIYASLDIGTYSIKLIVCELYKNKLNLLAEAQTPSIGIKRGLITDGTAARNSIAKVFDEIESMLGIRIRKVVVTIPSYQADFTVVKGSLDIENEKGIITGEDVKNVLNKAIAIQKPLNMEVVTDLPIDFKVDDKTGVKDPKGLPANHLEARSVLVTVPKKNLYSVVSVLENLEVEVVEASLNEIGDMAAFKNEQISENVSALINIGYETTHISLYNKGILIKTATLPLGSENIDNDLAYIYKVTRKTAQVIKEKFALAHKRNASVNDFYEITNTMDEKIKVNQFEATEIVMARLEELLSLAKKELTSLTSGDIPYIIITGGASNQADFEYIANDVFGKRVVLGNVKMLGIRSNAYSSALGNVIHLINRLRLTGTEYTMVNENDEEELDGRGRGVLNISGDSMLGKVFGYFWSE
ncbi:MAG: cell division protein FtsA [Bacilli bacterium]|nr:cell division protein FtsA [Bacilli bacterium]